MYKSAINVNNYHTRALSTRKQWRARQLRSRVAKLHSQFLWQLASLLCWFESRSRTGTPAAKNCLTDRSPTVHSAPLAIVRNRSVCLLHPPGASDAKPQHVPPPLITPLTLSCLSNCSLPPQSVRLIHKAAYDVASPLFALTSSS